MQGIKECEDSERGGGGGNILGWRLFEIFLSKGAISRRTTFIRGNTVTN